jgi:hypothetical protein
MESKNLKLRKVIAHMPSLVTSDEIKKSIHFNYESLPAAKNWKVGNKYYLMLYVEQTNTGKDSVDFDVLKVGEYKKGDNYGQ